MIIANGCTITLKDSAVNNGGGTVTAATMIGQSINDGIIKIKSGNYVSTGSKYSFKAGGKDETGHVQIDGGSFDATEGVVLVGKNSTLVVNGGNFVARDNAVFANNGSDGWDGYQITINDGIFEGHITTQHYTGCGIYAPNNGIVTVNGGRFTIDGVGIAARAGQINITGGEFTSTVNSNGWVGDQENELSPNGVYYDGGLSNYHGFKEGAAVNITGGTFTNTADANVKGVVISNNSDIEIAFTNSAGWTATVPNQE